ncbi:YHS domain-containing protein [Desulfobotulus pelophilus]|uniref:YHS domain-containing protein n=1 Tax=Desulfobotulus pelophilus TaxID=2823377 RepID=UPI0034A5A56D
MPGIIVTLILIYILWRLIVGPSRKAGNEIHEELVQDPVCGLYIPKSEALKGLREGQELYFCSEKCKDTYFLEDKSV